MFSYGLIRSTVLTSAPVTESNRHLRISAPRLIIAALLVCATTVAAPRAVLWKDPGDVRRRDFAGAVGASVWLPKAPFHFVREDATGTQPKIFVRDANGTEWNVKFGYEVKTEAFAWRIVRACGYFAEPNFLVPAGKIEGLPALQRPDPSLKQDGSFSNGRFQWRDPEYRFLKESWSWTKNPFRGSSQLAGLKVLIMLVSNWDNKDSSNIGPNTAIFQHGRERVYAFTDWGSGMGRWGHMTGQTDWRCDDFAAQTPEFVKGVKAGYVQFGYDGGHERDFYSDIRPRDLRWLLHYLGRLSDDQIKAGLRASGATPAEEECFAKALRARIDALRTASR